LKQCTACKEFLDDTEFSSRQSRCKPCCNAHQKIFRDEKRRKYDTSEHRNTSIGILPPRAKAILKTMSYETCLVPSMSGVFYWRFGDTPSKIKMPIEDSVCIDHLIEKGFLKLDIAAGVWGLQE
jgi:hypothetical protein